MRIVLFVSVVALVTPAWGHQEQPPLLQDVGFDQRLNEQVPLDVVFRDEAGNAVQFGEYFGAKPVVLAFAYYQCPMLCTFTLNGLLESLRGLSFDVGDQFNVIIVSMNPRETPALAAAKKEPYMQSYSRPGAAEGWRFLTGEEGSIQRLAQAVGFRYAYDAAKDQYAHATGIMVLTPQGRIARYFYGIEYSPTDLRLSLVEASADQIGSAVDELLLFCYRYDPVTGRYGVVIMNIIRLTGFSSVLALGTLIVAMLRRDRRKSRVEERGLA